MKKQDSQLPDISTGVIGDLAGTTQWKPEDSC